MPTAGVRVEPRRLAQVDFGCGPVGRANVTLIVGANEQERRGFCATDVFLDERAQFTRRVMCVDQVEPRERVADTTRASMTVIDRLVGRHARLHRRSRFFFGGEAVNDCFAGRSRNPHVAMRAFADFLDCDVAFILGEATDDSA